ncbi:MAG: polysaccharide biosynthesis tyrosine autokinase, partial [Chitinophagaceae bacterium]
IMASTAQKKSGKKESKSLLSEILFKYMPYWPLFVVFGTLSIFAAWFYLHKTAPQYEITAAIMLKDEKKGSSDGEMINSMDQLAGNKIVENELEVLKSRTLMANVVRNLNLYASFFEEDKLIPKSAYTTSPILIQSADPDGLKVAQKVKFEFSDKDSQVVIGAKKFPLNQLVQTDFGQLKFIPNKNFTHKAEKPLYFNIENSKAQTAALQGGLKAVPPSKLTTVVILKIRDTDPTRGEDILNELIAAYNKATLDDKNRLAANTSAFVEDRLGDMEKELKNIEQQAQSYKATRGAVDIGQQGQLFLKNVSENDQKVSDVKMQMAVLDQVEKYVASKDNSATNSEGIVPSTLGLKDPMLGQLLEKLYDNELNYEKLKKTTGENNPILTTIKDQITKIKPSVMENIRNQRSSLQASVLNLQATNNTYSSLLQSIPQKERELIDINRQQAIYNGIYSFLLQKKEESALSHANNTTESRVVDKAQSTLTPVSPKSKLIYMVALVFALILPAGFVTAKEFLNRKILFRHEIENLTSAPIIGEIIFNKDKNPVVIEEGKRTFIAEQFRRIRTSLGYLGLTTEKKRILVTSSLSGEGKSFVALNLALSLAVTDRKVILLELDLANPSLSTKLNVDYDKGVSNYLWGECEPEEIIRRSPINENLFFIPCGPLPDNPSELLMSERLKTLLDYLNEIFDHVIIDSAPASLLSDAYVLSPMCNATLYVVKHKFTPKIYMERLDEENQMNQLKNIGIIFNGIKSRGFTKNGYGYGYGYGYIHNKKTGTKQRRAKS